VGILIVLFVSLAAIAAWWLSHQRLTSKPWLEEGVIGEFPGSGRASPPTAKVGLGVFIAVAGTLFALFMSAYSMRMAMEDWRPMPVPVILWGNTAILVASSVALQWAAVAARRDEDETVKAALSVGAALALGFLVGQVAAWRELSAAGFYLASNPASAFFYLLTAVHGLHVLGGLAALARTAVKVRSGRPARLSVELCAIYWHFLLVVWLVLFGALLLESTGTFADLVALCVPYLLGTQ
jgi:cytochrome c oxidase subunit 3